MDKDLVDKIARAAIAVAGSDEDKKKLDRKQKFLLSTGTSMEDIKKWVPRVVESLSKENPYERLEHRDGKKFECPVNYATLEGSSMVIGDPFRPTGTAMESQKSDVASMVFNEILHHGRQTMDELEKHIGGIDKHLLTVVINAMRMDYYLKDYTEKGDVRERAHEKGLKTIELVDVKARRRKLKRELGGTIPRNNRKLTVVKKKKKTRDV